MVTERTTEIRKLIVTGCARSGTTLLHSMLVCFGAIKNYRFSETLPARLDARLESEWPIAAGKEYLLIKRPQFHPRDERHFTLGELLERGYRIINLIRDGRDVLVSRHPAAPDRYWVEPERWLAAVRDTVKQRNHPDLHIVRYEHLVTNPERCLDRIGGFLGIRRTRDYRNYIRIQEIRHYLNSADLQGARPVSADSIGSHRERAHRRRMNQIMGEYGDAIVELLGELGYEV